MQFHMLKTSVTPRAGLKVRSYYTAIGCGTDIYRLLSAASHRSFTTFQVQMNVTFMRHRNAVTSQFWCSTAMQHNCSVV